MTCSVRNTSSIIRKQHTAEKCQKGKKALKKGQSPKDYIWGVSENSCTPKSPILIGFSIINHPFWGTHMFGNTHIFGIYPRVANKGLDCDPRNLFLMFHFMSVTSQHPGGSYLSWWFFPTHLQKNRFVQIGSEIRRW